MHQVSFNLCLFVISCTTYLNSNVNGLRVNDVMVAHDCDPSKGKWRRIEDTDPKHPPVPLQYYKEFNAKETKIPEFMLWEWSSDDPKCAMTKLNKANFCDMMEKRNLTHFAIVGDSLNWQMALSFSRLTEQTGFGYDQKPFKKMMSCPSANITFNFFRNDFLDTSDKQDNCAPHRCSPWWKTYEKHAKETLLVADLGLHYNESSAFQRDFDRFVDFMAPVEPGLLVFRLSVPGHDKCNQYKQPFESPVEFHKNLYTGLSQKYQWQKIPEFNEYVKQKLPKKPNYMVLDVYPMTILRPDGHRSPGDITQKRTDCLHYKQPGVPDWWNHMLITELQK